VTGGVSLKVISGPQSPPLLCFLFTMTWIASSTTLSHCHDILHHHGIKISGTQDCGLKFLKLWAKINLFSCILSLWGIWLQQQKGCVIVSKVVVWVIVYNSKIPEMTKVSIYLYNWIWTSGYDTVVEHLPGMWRALSLLPNTARNKNTNVCNGILYSCMHIF
jgi:hypothetical protein